ncbi:CMRF35-like molecule 1 [Huso huso]|uniref:CMRF35-like molecule 1 n=1 Tax=Huso huso TaxID=61971 RepID=A0ABR0YHH1_HUSHU
MMYVFCINVVLKKRKDMKNILFFSEIRKLLLSQLVHWFSVCKMKFLVLLAALSGAAALSGPDQVNGLLRESVTIQCRYGKDYKDSVKYWCKGQFRISCITLISTDDLQTNDRISISDNKTEGVFTVTMRQLREEDEGYYCCGIRSKPLSLDEVTSVYLTVNKDMVTGWIQELVTIQCRYDKGFNNYVKYWSKGRIFKDSTVLVKTDETKTPNRISISDNKTEGVFTVTMRDLREEDEGRYWCGIKRIGYDEGTSEYLTVNKGTLKPTAKTTTTTTPTATTPTPTTERTAPATASTAVNTSSSPGQTGHTTSQDASNLLIILSVVCGCLLFLCVLCLIIRMKINRDKQKGAIRSSTPPSVTYTTVRFQNNAQTPAGDGIYANVNPSQRQTEAPQRSESVEYSVLAF